MDQAVRWRPRWEVPLYRPYMTARESRWWYVGLPVVGGVSGALFVTFVLGITSVWFGTLVCCVIIAVPYYAIWRWWLHPRLVRRMTHERLEGRPMSYVPFRILGDDEPEPEPKSETERRDWCHSHQRAEPLAPGDFRLCFECGHVWRTRAEFLADVEVGCREAGVPMDPDQPFCPLCTHDF